MAAQQYYSTPTNLKYCDDDDDDDDSSDTNEEVSDDDDNNYMEEEDDEDEEEQHSSCPSLVGSDEEYKYEADDTDSESGAEESAPKRRSKSGSSTRANPNKNTINSSGGRLRVWKEEEEITLLQCKCSCNTENFYTEINKLLPHKKRSQIKVKVRGLKDKFQKHKGDSKTNSHEKRLYDLSKRVWGNITTTTRQEEKSMNVDAEDMVLINDDVVVKGFDEYLSSRSLEINKKDRMKLVTLWRKVAYYKATHNLAVAMFGLDLQNYKVDGYNKC